MSDAVESVKSEILGCLADGKADAGHVLNLRALLHQRAIHWNPKQKDALEPAANELVSAGILEEKNGSYFLTQKGVDQLYPAVGSSVRNAVLSCFSESHARAGDVLNARALQHQHMLNWNPKQRAALDLTLRQLESEGLIESKNGNVVLTQKGFDALY